MIRKYVYGNPFQTDAVIRPVEIAKNEFPYGTVDLKKGFCFTYEMDQDTIVYGLGEANRGLNKRGYLYVSDCADDPDHSEDKLSLYGAHNFLLIDAPKPFGLFFDYPSKLSFDIGYTDLDVLKVSCADANLAVYFIEADSLLEIIKEFRGMIGRSYIPPKFAFGFGQSRWGYKTAEEFKEVVKQYRENHIPLDMLYMDIDYMDHYKDFTVNPEEFPDFKAFVSEMQQQDIHLVPIIDAGVKVEEGYDIYEEGLKKGYFCKEEDGTAFKAAVWPGYTHFPDVLNKEAREWFGGKYEILLDAGIDGFWNDMNEPAIFHSPKSLEAAKEVLKDFLQRENNGEPVWSAADAIGNLANKKEDYESFYHEVNGEKIRHDKVHNLFGYNMTRAAGEAFERLRPDHRILMFSRSSYIGMHRYGGVWQGDNKSWWSHLLLNMKMTANLNMCGFLYTGADLGGFGCNTTEDLLLRFLAYGVFTPLMRNHAALGTREQEAYRFKHIEAFRNVIGARYRMLPYIYSEYMKAALKNEMYIRPMAFTFTKDKIAKRIEDQFLIGEELMIAPIYTQNATGRFVYLPEEMEFVKFQKNNRIYTERLVKGLHYVEVALDEVSFFIRKGACIPITEFAENVRELQQHKISMIGYENSSYELYDDDGVSTNPVLEGHLKTLYH